MNEKRLESAFISLILTGLMEDKASRMRMILDLSWECLKTCRITCPHSEGLVSYTGSKKNPPLRADGLLGLIGREKTEHLNYFAASVSAREEGFRPKRVKHTRLRENRSIPGILCKESNWK